MQRFTQNESGATAIEYAVICAVVVLAMLTGLILLGQSNTAKFNNVADQASQHM